MIGAVEEERPRRWPSWKFAVDETVERWHSNREAFIPDEDLSRWFEEPTGSDAYRFALLAWENCLFDPPYRILVIRVRVPEKGYKIASNSEAAEQGFNTRRDRARAAMVKAMRVGTEIVDYGALTAEEQRKLDDKMNRLGRSLAVISPRIAERLLPPRFGYVLERPPSTAEALEKAK